MTQPHQHPTGGHGGHRLMMIACCIPMLVVAVALVATRVVSLSFLFIAIGCTVLMALMMRGMGDVDSGTSHGGSTEEHDRATADNDAHPDHTHQHSPDRDGRTPHHIGS